jgi:hypothetical protein
VPPQLKSGPVPRGRSDGNVIATLSSVNRPYGQVPAVSGRKLGVAERHCSSDLELDGTRSLQDLWSFVLLTSGSTSAKLR